MDEKTLAQFIKAPQPPASPKSKTMSIWADTKYKKRSGLQ